MVLKLSILKIYVLSVGPLSYFSSLNEHTRNIDPNNSECRNLIKKNWLVSISRIKSEW